MLCQKTSASDEAIVCWCLHTYLYKWIQEFQEEEEYSAANGGQRHPKRNKGKGKHISRLSLQYYMLSEKKIQAARGGLEIPNDWNQGVFSESNRLYYEEKKRMMGIPTGDAAAVRDGERKENQKVTGVTMNDYIIVPFEI